MTSTGSFRDTDVPSPSCPRSFAPQQYAVPTEVTAHEWSAPLEMDVKVTLVAVSVGVPLIPAPGSSTNDPVATPETASEYVTANSGDGTPVVGTGTPAGNPALAFGTMETRDGLTLSRMNAWLTPLGSGDESAVPTKSAIVDDGETPRPTVEPAPPSPLTDAVESETVKVVVATDTPGLTDATAGDPTIPGPRAT